MKCIKCSARTDVYDSRLIEGRGYRRKRKCEKCGFRFATIEILDTAHELRAPTVKVEKPPKAPRVQKVRQPKPVRSRSVKPRRPEDDMYEPEPSLDEDMWDVARELGIERYR
jgi:transcriptional regulator NrdR family protein